MSASRSTMLAAVLVSTLLVLPTLAVDESSTAQAHSDPSPRFVPEPECSAMGGQCLHSLACEKDKISSDARCPVQYSMGAVCCYGQSKLERDCAKLTGECKPRCPQNLVVSQADNCPAGEVCCVLV